MKCAISVGLVKDSLLIGQ